MQFSQFFYHHDFIFVHEGKPNCTLRICTWVQSPHVCSVQGLLADFLPPTHSHIFPLRFAPGWRENSATTGINCRASLNFFFKQLIIISKKVITLIDSVKSVAYIVYSTDTQHLYCADYCQINYHTLGRIKLHFLHFLR